MCIRDSDKAAGLLSAAYLKDPTDAQWKNDPGVKAWEEWMKKYLPGADLARRRVEGDDGPAAGQRGRGRGQQNYQ